MRFVRHLVNNFCSSDGCLLEEIAYIKNRNRNEAAMKEKVSKSVEQPEPFTPGVTKGMVRQRALELYRDKLRHEGLTLEDWVLAEKDLVSDLETDGLLKR